jgi:ribosomal protein S27AE
MRNLLWEYHDNEKKPWIIRGILEISRKDPTNKPLEVSVAAIKIDNGHHDHNGQWIIRPDHIGYSVYPVQYAKNRNKAKRIIRTELMRIWALIKLGKITYGKNLICPVCGKIMKQSWMCDKCGLRTDGLNPKGLEKIREFLGLQHIKEE